MRSQISVNSFKYKCVCAVIHDGFTVPMTYIYMIYAIMRLNRMCEIISYLTEFSVFSDVWFCSHLHSTPVTS